MASCLRVQPNKVSLYKRWKRRKKSKHICEHDMVLITMEVKRGKPAVFCLPMPQTKVDSFHFFLFFSGCAEASGLKLSKTMIQGCGWWMSVSALIAEGHVYRPPVCIRHLAPSKGAPPAHRNTATLPSAALMNATSRFHFSMHWAGGTSSMGLGRRQFSLTCPTAAALKCFLGLVWKQDSVLGLRRRRHRWRQLCYWCKDQTKEVFVDGATDHKLWTHLKYRWGWEAKQQHVLAAGSGLFLVIPDCRLHFLSVLVCSSELIEENMWAIMTHYDSFMSLLMFCVGTTA